METIDSLIAYYEERAQHPDLYPMADTQEKRLDTAIYLRAYRQARLALVTLAQKEGWRIAIEGGE